MTQVVFAGDEPRDYLDPQIGHVEPGDVREVDDATVASLQEHESERWTNAVVVPPKKTTAPKSTSDSSATDATPPAGA